jgi:hypothetical protein
MNFRLGFLAASLLSLLCLFAPAPASASNIVLNGDFSAGGASWSTTSDFYGYSFWGFAGEQVGTNPATVPVAFTGCNPAYAACTDINAALDNQADLFQTLSTKPGDSYTLSFQYSPGGGTINELLALFGSAQAIALVNLPASDVNLAPYTVSGLVANSTTTELDFLAQTNYGFVALTDVSVVDNGHIIPEPSTLVLLGSGMALIAALAGRKHFV